MKLIYKCLARNQSIPESDMIKLSRQNLAIRSVNGKYFDEELLLLSLKQQRQETINQVVQLLELSTGSYPERNALFIRNISCIVNHVSQCCHPPLSHHSSYTSLQIIDQPTELKEVLNQQISKFIQSFEHPDPLIQAIVQNTHYSLIDPYLIDQAFDLLPRIITEDEVTFSSQDNEAIHAKLKRAYTLFLILAGKKMTFTDQLYQIGVFYCRKSLKYFDIQTTPIFYKYLVTLSQTDQFNKNKLQNIINEIFEAIARNIHKASIVQIYEFAKSFERLRYLGFQKLSSIQIFLNLAEVHYSLTSFALKVKTKLSQLGSVKDNLMFEQMQLILQKLKFLAKSVGKVFIQAFYLDDTDQKLQNEKRVHLIIQLWNTYFEAKPEPEINDYYSKCPLFAKDMQQGQEEYLVKKLSFLQICNRFLIRDKNMEASFSSEVIIELLFPKIDICSLLQQLLLSKASEQLMHHVIKRLYKFYLNLMANAKDKSLRDKSLKDLSKSISYLLLPEFLLEKGSLLHYVAHKIQSNYYQCDFEEQVKVLNEILTVIVQQFAKIEDEFFVSIETCKGSVEGMRQLSLFRQLMQKAQGKNNANLSVASIVEKKVIDLKRLSYVFPLLSKCTEVFADHQFQNWNNPLKQRTQSLILEFWMYISINTPLTLKEKKTPKQTNHNNGSHEFQIVIQPLRDMYEQMDDVLNSIAFVTPNLLPAHKISFLDSKILILLTENKESYTSQNFYIQVLRSKVKLFTGVKKKVFKSKLEINDLLFIVIINQILGRCQNEMRNHISRLQTSSQSYISKFIGFIRSQYNDEEHERERLTNTLIRDAIQKAGNIYTKYLQQTKGTLTKDIICRDFVYLVQLSCSIEKSLKEYASTLVIEFIKNFPFVCFSPQVIKVFAEIISFLYQKIGREFDSKSTYIQQEQVKYKILVHTDQKQLTINLVFLMNCMLKLVFRGLYIDHNFIKVLILHFIKQETSLMSELPFGYRFIKFLITSFKIDKDIIEAFKNQADRYNPYFWLVRVVEFDAKISVSDLSQFVVDKGLIKLQKIQIEEKMEYNICHDILKQIDQSIKNEIEFDFHLDERQYNTTNQVQYILQQINNLCQEISACQYFSINKAATNAKLLQKMQTLGVIIRQEVKQLTSDCSQYKQVKKILIKEMLKQVTQLKSVICASSLKGAIISQLFDLCKQYLQPQLLKFILLRLIPYLHSVSPNYFDSTFFFLLGEMLHYTVYQINNLGNLKYDKKTSSQDVFQIRSNYFNSLQELEIEELTGINFVNIMQIGYYEMRWKSLCKIHLILIRFFNENMQIHLVKNVKLSVISNILKLNFLADKKIVEFIPLQNVCEVLKGSIEIIQLMKDLKEKFNVESIYYKTLKFGLGHFSKNVNLYRESLFTECMNQQKLIKRHNLYSMVCKYLSKDKLHELNEESKITRLKRVKKRFNSVVFKKHRQEKLNLDVRATIVIDGWASSMNRRIQADIGFNGQQIYAINISTGQSEDIRPYYLRKALFYLLCDELDKLKAFAHKLQEDLPNEYSLLTQNKLSENFIQQILNEIPDKNLNLAYNILLKFYPIIQTQCQSVHQVFYQFLGAKISQNHSQYLDCAHFFDILVTHNQNNISLVQKDLIYWKPPHIQLLLKYITHQYQDHPEIKLLFSKIMKRLHSEQIIFYLPQILQAIASKSGSLIQQFLIEFAQQSVLFAHQLIWLCKVECKIDMDHKRPPSPKNVPENFKVLHSHQYIQQVNDLLAKQQITKNQVEISRLTPGIISKVIRNMDSEQTSFFKKVDGFFERVTAISGILKPQMEKPRKREIIAAELKTIDVSPDIYLPTNPRYQITQIKLDSGQPMQSAAKCPILVAFYCKKYEGPDRYFERKLQLKRSIMKSMEMQMQMEYDKQFEVDDVDEERGVDFLNQLIRPINGSRNAGMIVQKVELQKQKSADTVIHALETKRKMVSAKTELQMEQNNQSESELKMCIFKVFDDIRQDTLALQIIQMFKGVFEKLNLDLHVFPYKCISNRTGKHLDVGGIIEVIPNSSSRDALGKTNLCNLYDYFLQKFGSEDSLSFQQARENFIKSQAAYSIISYILQIKDRHNGNILISETGHLIHIDFGFIFDISPAGNMKFESANFKLTKEMILIMGGSNDSEAFKYYVDLTVRAFLAVRKYYDHMYYIVKLMVNSGLGCFQKDSLKNFTERFQLKKNDLAAAKYIKGIIADAFDKMTTRLYDDIQFYQNGISR